MTKTITRSAHQGDAGIALIHRRVSDMGFNWHGRDGSLDAGIDGEIELRDPGSGEVFNRFVLVQSKASDLPFAGEGQDGEGFHFLCSPDDIDYWMGGDDPVIMVCSHPKSDEAWWADIRECFADPERRASRRLEFDKRTHVFDKTAREKILDVGEASRAGYVPRTEYRHETLQSNLLEVKSTPPLIFSARSTCRKPGDVFGRLRKAGVELRYDWVLADGRLHSFSNPEECGLLEACDGKIDVISVDDWAHTDDTNIEHRFVTLLNKSLRQMTLSDLDWHEKPIYLYFRAPEHRRRRQLPTGKGSLRTVFMPKGKYFWHAGMKYQFLCVDDVWYLAIVPTYHFTQDGVRESQFSSSYLATIKRMERDKSVLAFTCMWATFLRADTNGALFERGDQLIEFGELVAFDVEQGIDDEAWAASGRSADVIDDQMDLFAENYEDFDS